MVSNRRWILAKRPHGQIQVTDFEEDKDEIPPLQDGEYLIKNLYLSFDPTQRGWVNDAPSYLPPVKLGEPMRAFAVGEVIESKNDQFQVGDLVSDVFGWQEYILVQNDGYFRGISSSKARVEKLPPNTPVSSSLNIAGLVGLTAYFGLLRVGNPKTGDVVLVSGAAGATGSLVGQIAKIKGCHVIGIAGGEEKCKWIKELGFDAAIDYKSEDVRQRLKELAPNGVNIFFENVGGEILEAGLDNMVLHGTVVQCGTISTYNATEPKGPKNYSLVVRRRLRIEGFIVLDYMKDYPHAKEELLTWSREGKIKSQEDVQQGFENIPQTLLRLFTGANVGKQLLKF